MYVSVYLLIVCLFIWLMFLAYLYLLMYLCVVVDVSWSFTYSKIRDFCNSLLFAAVSIFTWLYQLLARSSRLHVRLSLACLPANLSLLLCLSLSLSLSLSLTYRSC